MKYARTPSVLQLFFFKHRKTIFYFINTQKTHKHEASATEIYKSKDIYIIINEKCAWHKLNEAALNQRCTSKGSELLGVKKKKKKHIHYNYEIL